MNLQKNRSQKLSMQETKNKDSFGICIKFRTKLRIPIIDFRLIFLMREDFRIKITITFFSPEKN